jgi:hypothetical protein
LRPCAPSHDPESVDAEDYERLAALRAGIRTYLAWAEECARDQPRARAADG